MNLKSGRASTCRRNSPGGLERYTAEEEHRGKQDGATDASVHVLLLNASSGAGPWSEQKAGSGWAEGGKAEVKKAKCCKLRGAGGTGLSQIPRTGAKCVSADKCRRVSVSGARRGPCAVVQKPTFVRRDVYSRWCASRAIVLSGWPCQQVFGWPTQWVGAQSMWLASREVVLSGLMSGVRGAQEASSSRTAAFPRAPSPSPACCSSC